MPKDYSLICEQIMSEVTLQFGGASASGLPSIPAFAVGCYCQIASGTGGIRIRQDGQPCTATTGIKFVNETSVTPTIIKLMSYTDGLPLHNVSIYATDALLSILYFKE